MEFKVIWLVFGFIVSVLAQKNFVGEINFSFREEQIPTIINHLLNVSLETQNISTLDIIKLSKLDGFNLDETLSVLTTLNISTETAFNVNNLEFALKALNISFREFLQDWNTFTSTALTQPILQALNINATSFFMTYTLKIEDIYDVLRDGIYDKDHVEAALAVSGKTSTEIYSATRDLFVHYVTYLPSSQFMDTLKSKGWKLQTTSNLIKAANITLKDIYNVDKFKSIFSDVINNLNANLSVAVFVAADQVAIHKVAYDTIKNKIDGYTIKPTVMGLEVELYKAVFLGPHIVGLKTKQVTNDFIPITDTYNTTQNCSYVMISNGQISSVSVLLGRENFKIIKTNQTVFHFGSPLICNEHLYGLSKSEDFESIEFDRFYEQGESNDYYDLENQKTDDHSGTGGILFYFNFFIIIQLNLCHIIF